MKFFLLLAVLLFGVWLWRSGRSDQSREKKTPPPATPQNMVRCAHCGLHLPQADAVPGRAGLYCSTEHRQLAES